MSRPGVFGRAEALALLQTSRRRLDRLDHWVLDAWVDSPALRFAPVGGAEWAATLAVPVDTDGPGDWLPRAGGPAWLRWCAVTDAAAFGPALRRLFADAIPFFQSSGLSGLWALGDEARQFDPYLADEAFVAVDAVITLEKRTALRLKAATAPGRPACVVRDVAPGDWLALNALDARAFGDPWRYGRAMFALELAVANLAIVALVDGRPAGYATATAREARAHINRLAVDPAAQGRGVGGSLLTALVSRLTTAGALRITLNTQASNGIAQRLYQSAGFRPAGASLRVYHRPFP